VENRDWTLITVTYNSEAELRAIWAEVDLDEVDWIVADNASSDDSAVLAESLGARMVRLDRNMGFARANNAALALASTRFVAFVNPDVRVLPGSLGLLAETIDDFGAIVSPQLVDPDGSDQPNGRGLPYLVDKVANRGVLLPGADLGAYLPEIGPGPTPVDWFMGAVVAGRRDDFTRTGGWDERFFLYYEDHVMGLRAWERGQAVLIEPRVRWVHGWARETSGGFRLAPWKREIASAVRFYRMFPELLLPLRRRRTPRSLRAASPEGAHADR